MAKRIFKIGGASEEEVEGVRSTLRENGVSFFETPHGNFGLSMAGIWVENDAEAQKARKLIDQFQESFRTRVASGKASSKFEWRFVSFGILLVILLIWMMVMGYSR